MAKSRFRFSPDILRRLGEELNPNVDQGLLELVKNAYDADARNCTIEIENVKEFFNYEMEHSSITISDDGNGMDLQEIEEGWLVLGSSSKQHQMYSPRFHRKIIGSKGLGRLAALRMGSKARLISRPRIPAETEYELVIDWRKFDESKIVDEVELEILERPKRSKHGFGIEIEISELGEKVNRINIRRFARGLLLLADPFTDDPTSFKPTLIATEFKDLERLIKKRYFDDAEFHLLASVDSTGNGQALVLDYKGQELFGTGHKELSIKRKGKAYSCPPIVFDLWSFILSGDKFVRRMATITEIREWLTEFGGVHLYHNRMRVAPYGDPGNDWLDMNLKRAKSPEYRPSTNTSIGRIAVDDPEMRLIQKTDRSGLIDNEVFQEVKRFASDALDWMARRRLAERDQKRTIDRSEALRKVDLSKESITKAIDSLPSSEQNKIRQPFKIYESARDKEAVALRKEVQLYRTLSTAGITTALFAHESGHPLDIIVRNAKHVIKILKSDKALLPDNYSKAMDRIIRQTESLKSFGNLTLSLISSDKRKVSRVNVYDVITCVIQMFQMVFSERHVAVQLNLDPGNPYLRGSEAAVESIFTNLITNSIKAFEVIAPCERKIAVCSAIMDEWVEIRVMDNGPGIEGINIGDIWLPGETTYPNGTGLGLTIVGDTVKDMGGNVEAIKHGELGGAEFIVHFPILGA